MKIKESAPEVPDTGIVDEELLRSQAMEWDAVAVQSFVVLALLDELVQLRVALEQYEGRTLTETVTDEGEG